MQTPPSAQSAPPLPSASDASEDLSFKGPVHLKARTPSGEEIAVEIADVPFSKMAAYAEKLHDLGAFVELVTGKPKDWSDSLLIEDVLAIDAAAQALNTPRFRRWLLRQREVAEFLDTTFKRAGFGV